MYKVLLFLLDHTSITFNILYTLKVQSLGEKIFKNIWLHLLLFSDYIIYRGGLSRNYFSNLLEYITCNFFLPKILVLLLVF